MCYRARMGATLAELLVLVAVVWLVARLLTPLRLRIERALLRRLAPERADIIDAEVLPASKKKKE